MNKERLIESLTEIQRLVPECLAAVNESETPVTKSSAKHKPAAALGKTSQAPDFRLPVRAFMKEYAVGLNGQQKFALVVAFFFEGCGKHRNVTGNH